MSPSIAPNTGKYGPEETPHLDTFHAVTLEAYLEPCQISKMERFVKIDKD